MCGGNSFLVDSVVMVCFDLLFTFVCVCLSVCLFVSGDSQSHRPKGLIDLKECMLYPVHPSLYGRSVNAVHKCTCT